MNKGYLHFLLCLAVAFSLPSCSRENLRKAKATLLQESQQEMEVVILFDNSLSYKPYISQTLSQVLDVFKYLAKNHPQCSTSLVLIDQKATIIWSGTNKDLQKPYDELKRILQTETSPYTDLVGAVERGLYFLNKDNAAEKYLLIFSDMKHSTPSYYPSDKELVPPPAGFPWEEINRSEVHVFVFFVPYTEWKAWSLLAKEKGVDIKGFLPEELKTKRAVQIVFGEG